MKRHRNQSKNMRKQNWRSISARLFSIEIFRLCFAIDLRLVHFFWAHEVIMSDCGTILSVSMAQMHPNATRNNDMTLDDLEPKKA